MPSRRVLLSAVLAVPVLALSACGGDDDEPAGATDPTVAAPGTTAPADGGDLAATLDGRTFLSTAVDGQVLVDGTTIRLEFDGDRLGVAPGCNTAGGSWSLEGDVLVAGDLAMTEMACDPAALMDQDAWVLELLGARPALTLDGDTLTVAGDGVTITFSDRVVADPDRPLEGTTWTLETLIAGDIAASLPAGMRAPTLRVADGHLELDTGCNTGGADVTVADGSLAIDAIALTRMACADPAAQDVERQQVEVLEGAPSVAIVADVLTITQGDQALQYRAG